MAESRKTGGMTPRQKLAVTLLGTLSLVWSSVGCSPATLGMMLYPWVDDRLPARCPLASKDREVKIAIVSNFTSPTTRLDVAGADQEMAEQLLRALRDRYRDNGEKVRFVAPSQIRAYQARRASSVVMDQEIGKQFKADYVLTLDIKSLDLHERGAAGLLYRGNADIDIHVMDMNRPEGEGRIYEDSYRTTYPKHSPMDASGKSAIQFRSEFLRRVARDISRTFAKHDPTELHQID